MIEALVLISASMVLGSLFACRRQGVPWRVIVAAGAGGLLLAAGVVAAIAADRRAFKPGDCIIYSAPKESWETRTIYRIDEIGKEKYRATVWLDDYKDWSDAGPHGLSFIMESVYAKTTCPDQARRR